MSPSLIVVSAILIYRWQFNKRYRNHQFRNASLHYADSDPRIELVFYEDQEVVTTTRSLRDQDLRILSVGLGYSDGSNRSMVELTLQFYHWTFMQDVPRVCVKGRSDFKSSEVL